MNNADVNFNKITDLINLNNEKEMKAFDLSKNLETEKEAIDFQKNQNLEKTNKGNNNIITFQKISQNLEKIFSTDEKKELDRRFLLYSSDGIMSNRQFWNFLDLGQIANSTFAKLFYKAVCDFNDNTKLDHLKFMDRYKFYQFIAIFTKTNELNQNKNLFFDDNDKLSEFDDEDKLNSFASYVKLKFLNSLFDIDNNDEVDRLEFRNLISSFIEMILSCKFECGPIQEQINNILNIDTTGGNNNISQLMEKVLDLYVDEVFSRSYTGETLTFDEWKKWLIDEVVGINEILEYSTLIVNNAIDKD
jgi:hypothetical protein